MTVDCMVCRHPRAPEVNVGIVDGRTYTELSDLVDCSPSTISRHAQHLPERVAQAASHEAMVEADTLLGRVRALADEAHRLRRQAEEEGNLSTALRGLREVARLLELEAKVAGDIDERPQIAVVQVEGWGQVLEALRPYPDALSAVREALSS